VACFATRRVVSEIFQRCHEYPPMAWLGDTRCLDGQRPEQSRISTWLAASFLRWRQHTTGHSVKVIQERYTSFKHTLPVVP
jgi:hypothetical protein